MPGQMLAFLGLMTSAAGFFLFFWYRILVSLPKSRQPRIIHRRLFKWGIPTVSLTLFAAGLYQLAVFDMRLAGTALAAAVLLSWLLIKFDRYSAEMRIIHDRYRKVRAANPGMEEVEILFQTARWRYPQWSHDRIVELVAGKDIVNLMLLMLIDENKINPISDWELYRSVKAKAVRIADVAR